MNERTSWTSLRERRMSEPVGRTTPTVAMLSRLARALGVELRISVGPRHDVA